MNWYIGQEIVCINSKGAENGAGQHSGLKENKIYTIKGLKEGCCAIEINVGIKDPFPNEGKAICYRCKNQRKKDGIWWFDESRFAPLEYNADAIAALLKVTKPEEITK